MSYAHTNRHGVVYYLHQRADKRGTVRFSFARDVGDGALAAIPEGYEVRETANGVVSLAKIEPRLISEIEERIVRAALPKQAQTSAGAATVGIAIYDVMTYEVEIRGATIFINEGKATGLANLLGRTAVGKTRFSPVLRFDLTDEKTRRFSAKRMTYRGEGGWSHSVALGDLRAVVAETVARLGKDSFFELM